MDYDVVVCGSRQLRGREPERHSGCRGQRCLRAQLLGEPNAWQPEHLWRLDREKEVGFPGYHRSFLDPTLEPIGAPIPASKIMEHRVASPPILCVRGLRGQQFLPYS